MSSAKYQFWIDCGGTFTDIIAVNKDGSYRVHKLLSHSPHYKSAVVQGISDVLGHSNFKAGIEEVRLGTTVTTNAFLEKKGVPCALVTTLGQRDVLEIRTQERPNLFDLDITKIPPLYRYVTHIKGRMNSLGEVIEPLDLEIAEFELKRILSRNIKSLSISLMHSTKNPEHERSLGELARELGFDYVSLGHEISPISKYISRTETSVLDAYLTPYIQQYTKDLEKDLDYPKIFYMKSDGSLCNSSGLKGHNSLLSGPAGGLVGAIDCASKLKRSKIISFDMGGTSTDVGIFDGDKEVNLEPQVEGRRILEPMLNIHTVAAGGGSILKFDGQRLTVGPESAGAYPGPACYRNGGPLTVTDANLYLGRIEKENFPNVFGPSRDQEIDFNVVENKFKDLALEVGTDPRSLAAGFLEVAVETMANAIKKVSVEKGKDPCEYSLFSFGGAGGQLAAKVAEKLNIKEIIFHPLSSVLSAYGIGQARQTKSLKSGPEKDFRILEKKLLSTFPFSPSKLDRFFILRVKKSDHEIQVKAQDLDEAKRKFDQTFLESFGLHNNKEVEVIAHHSMISSCDKVEIDYEFVAENRFKGQKVISENNTCFFIDTGWNAKKNEIGTYLLKKLDKPKIVQNQIDQVRLELFYQRLQFIAEQMGYRLQKLAHSVNIKERNDFSCAIFSERGELLANAPHIPVHLGSMGDAVKAVINLENIKEGSSYILNDPCHGGTHLPDVTIITPYFYCGEIRAWLASRGHHSDIGGISPGSMPGNSRFLEEEGVIISPCCIVEKNSLDEVKLTSILSGGKYPARDIHLNLHDIKAKVAANHKGSEELNKLLATEGPHYLKELGETLLNYSHEKIKERLLTGKKLSAFKKVSTDRELKVELRNENEKIVFDFTGSSPELDSNFNTPVPVLKASILFVLRSLIKEKIPLNDGLMRGVKIILPKNSMLNPGPNKAVVAGNVESSQAICDLLFVALQVKANSQGTMNNLSFGNEKYQYYETLGGGSGATGRAKGASALQVNMTNSRLTDPEVFEERFPVQIELMAIRYGSGGLGKQRGGDGILRRFLFLEQMEVSMISQSRLIPPSGICEGGPAQRGINAIESHGIYSEMDECFTVDVKADDRLYIETPGGGGFGKEKTKPLVKVFGFGSNMDIIQIKERCPSSKILRRAKVKDKELRYTRFSPSRQGGVADMFHAPGKSVWGLIVEMNEEDLLVLDGHECKNNIGYKRIEVQCIDDNGDSHKVYAYDVIDKRPDIAPTNIYEWLVYTGAYYLNAPNQYLQHIKAYR